MVKTLNSNSKFLLLLIFIVVFRTIVWALFMPLWHFPDEQAHFSQISLFVETGKMLPYPDFLSQDTSKEIVTSEELLGTSRDWAGNNKFTYHPEYNIQYSQTTIGPYEKDIVLPSVDDRKTFVKKEATSYPPLYYILASIPYRMVYSSDLLTRVFAVRLANIVFSVLLVLFCYKLFRSIFPKNQILVYTATILVAFQPMLTFVSSGINSDNLFNLVFSAGIYLSFSLLKKKYSVTKILLLIGLLFVAVQTKPQGIILVYVYLIPVIVQVMRSRYRWFLSGLGLVFLFIPGVMIATRASQGHQILPDVALAGLSLPALTFWDHLRWSLSHTYREVMPWYWGVFKWLGLVLPRPINRVINWLMVISLFGLLLYTIEIIKKRYYHKLFCLFYLAYIPIGYFLILTFWDFLFTRGKGFSIGIQGRYFFPILPVHMALVILGLGVFNSNQRIKVLITKILGLGMMVLNSYAFWYVLSSYYDRYHIVNFFLQASQYKPWFAKSPYLESWLILYSVVLLSFIYRYIKMPSKHL